MLFVFFVFCYSCHCNSNDEPSIHPSFHPSSSPASSCTKGCRGLRESPVEWWTKCLNFEKQHKSWEFAQEKKRRSFTAAAPNFFLQWVWCGILIVPALLLLTCLHRTFKRRDAVKKTCEMLLFLAHSWGTLHHSHYSNFVSAIKDCVPQIRIISSFFPS